MSYLRLLAVFFRIGALNELAYRANFWIQAFESLVSVASVLGMIGVLFAQTDMLGDWSVWQLVALAGVYFLVYGLIQLVLAPSLSQFMDDVHQGTFDFTLTKPEDAQLLVSVSQVRVWKLIDVLAGLAVLGYALLRLGRQVGWPDAARFGVAMVAGGALVYSFWILLATLAFWFIRIENILMIFWSMYTAGRWPVGIYPDWLRWVLTLVVPIAFAVTVPAEAIAGRLGDATLGAAVAFSLALLVASRMFWRLGLRHYTSASS